MIIIKVINCDELEIEFHYEDIDTLNNEWYAEDHMPDIPMLDDQLVYAEVDGVIVEGKTCIDVMNYIGDKYNWKY